MKTRCVNTIVYATLLGACNLVKEDTKDFVPGTYVASFKDSVSAVNDTFYIDVLTKSGSDQYAVINRVAYQQTIDGHAQPLNNKTNNWTGTYDEKYKTISVNQTGVILAFDPTKDEMKLGTVSYKRVKP